MFRCHHTYIHKHTRLFEHVNTLLQLATSSARMPTHTTSHKCAILISLSRHIAAMMKDFPSLPFLSPPKKTLSPSDDNTADVTRSSSRVFPVGPDNAECTAVGYTSLQEHATPIYSAIARKFGVREMTRHLARWPMQRRPALITDLADCANRR